MVLILLSNVFVLLSNVFDSAIRCPVLTSRPQVFSSSRIHARNVKKVLKVRRKCQKCEGSAEALNIALYEQLVDSKEISR